MSTVRMPPRNLRQLIPALVSVAALAILFLRIDGGAVMARIAMCNWRWLCLALLVTASFPFLAALRWHAVIEGMGLTIGFRTCLCVTLAAFPLNAFLPSKAGDLIRAALLRRRGGFFPLAGSVLFERLVDILVLTVMSIFGAVVLFKPTLLVLATACLLGAAGGVAMLVFHDLLPLPDRFHNLAGEIAEATKAVFKRPAILLEILLWSVINWLGTMVESYFLFMAVGAPLSIMTLLAVLPLAIFVGLLPISVAGMGTRDGALVLLLSGLSQPERVLAMGLLYTAVSYWFLGLLGLPMLGKALAESGLGRIPKRSHDSGTLISE